VPVLSFTTTESEAGHRLDMVIVARWSTLSRSRASRLIRTGHITVNGLIKKPGYLTKSGDIVRSEIPSPEPITCRPEAIPLSVLHEDRDVIVLNKPPGFVVHPGAGHHSRTLVNALLSHCPDLEGVGGRIRPGIVHRLDKDTSGTLVVAKNDMAHASLSHQFKMREVRKVYLALVYGNVRLPAGVIHFPIGRHPTDRKKMSIHSRRSRSTETRWKVKEAFSGVTLLEIDLRTGRTHQVRVHCAAIDHPVVGDATYGGKRRWKDLARGPKQDVLRAIRRQMLHGWQLGFVHPRTGQWMNFESPLPKDMASVLESLRVLGAEVSF
jgi:23S rRNA pseudouridine1911/1915/1917 synthase